MSLLAALLLLLPQTHSPGASGMRVVTAEHERGVADLRNLRLLDAIEGAAGERREQARKAIEDARRRGAGVNTAPPLERVLSVTRELNGVQWVSHAGPIQGPAPEQIADQRALQALLDSIDLVSAPGVFAPRSEGRGEALTVHVRALFPAPDGRDLRLSLVWVGPDGDEVLARTEPVAVRALRDGFPMYLRPPASAPGTWSLVAEAERDGLVARGIPLEVHCIERLEERIRRASEEGGEPGGGDVLLRRTISNLSRFGARTVLSLSPEEMLRELEGERAPDRPRPLERAFVEPDGSERWIWAHSPAQGVERVLVVLVPARESTDLILTGSLGARWRALADEQRALLLVTALPPSGADETVPGLLQRVGEHAHSLGLPAGGERILVARGDAVSRLSIGLLGVDETDQLFHSIVMSTVVLSATPEAAFEGTPRLLLSPGGQASVPGEPGGVGEFTWIDGSSYPLLNEPQLPGIVGAWLTARGQGD